MGCVSLLREKDDVYVQLTSFGIAEVVSPPRAEVPTISYRC